MARIYTKTGDSGTTGIFGRRMSKGDKLADVLGSIDELNSYIGVCRQQINTSGRGLVLDIELKRIQNNLMTIASDLAGSMKYDLRFMNYETRKLEKLIDKLTEEMPKLHNFIYPTGYLQMARAVARKTEREVVRYFSSTPFEFPPNLGGNNKRGILKYLNRLSDALFVMGRWVNFKKGYKEEVWRK